MAMAVAFLLLLLVPLVVYAKDIDVGGSSGWTTGFDYSTWAAGQNFIVNDKLVFTYGSSHSVDEVSKNDYDNCNTGNPISSFSSSPTSITLSKAGPRYFICPRSNHCDQGMKLSITVTATSTSPPGGPPPSSPPSPTTPSPPSPTTPSPPKSPGSPPTPSSPPSSTSAPPPPSGAAASIYGDFTHLMGGLSLVLATFFVFMG